MKIFQKKVLDSLPEEHAQNIFREAFNNTYKQYNGDEKQAFEVAWAAVKNEYKKTADGKWIKK